MRIGAELRTVRAEVVATAKGTDASARLLALARTRAATDAEVARRALASAALVQTKHVTALKPGRALLESALRALTRLAERHPQCRAWWRDAQVSLGNLHAAYGRHHDAIRCLRAALDGEARVHLTLGFDGGAVAIIRALKDEPLSLRPVTVEHRYLGLMARMRFDEVPWSCLGAHLVREAK